MTNYEKLEDLKNRASTKAINDCKVGYVLDDLSIFVEDSYDIDILNRLKEDITNLVIENIDNSMNIYTFITMVSSIINSSICSKDTKKRILVDKIVNHHQPFSLSNRYIPDVCNNRITIQNIESELYGIITMINYIILGRILNTEEPNEFGEIVNNIKNIQLSDGIDKYLIDVVDQISNNNYDMAYTLSVDNLDYFWARKIDNNKKHEIMGVIDKLCKLINPKYISKIEFDIILHGVLKEDIIKSGINEIFEDSVLCAQLLDLQLVLKEKCSYRSCK